MNTHDYEGIDKSLIAIIIILTSMKIMHWYHLNYSCWLILSGLACLWSQEYTSALSSDLGAMGSPTHVSYSLLDLEPIDDNS